mgnify:FL=1
MALRVALIVGMVTSGLTSSLVHSGISGMRTAAPEEANARVNCSRVGWNLPDGVRPCRTTQVGRFWFLVTGVKKDAGNSRSPRCRRISPTSTRVVGETQPLIALNVLVIDMVIKPKLGLADSARCIQSAYGSLIK